jgi:hypothetical protein
MTLGAKRWTDHGGAILLVVVAVVWRFRRLVFDGVFVVADDALDQHYPLVARLFSDVRQGRFALWSPEILFGYPAAASVDFHLFSPLQWPYLVFEPHVAVAVRALALTFTSALLMYALARHFGTTRKGAAAAGMLWATGAPAVYMMIFPAAAATTAWFPLALIAWDRAWRQMDPRWAAAAGGALGLGALGGHMQLVYWCVLFLLAYAALVAPVDLRTPKRLAAGLAIAAIFGAVALTVAAVYVLPTLALLQDSVRSVLSGEERTSRVSPSYANAVRALSFVFFYGDHPDFMEEDVEYREVGVLSVALSLLALGKGRRFDNRLAALGVTFLVISMATVFPPSHWLIRLMPGNNFRYPERIGLFFTLCVVLLAARGLDRLLTGTAPRVNRIGVGVFALALMPAVQARLNASDPLTRSEGATDLAALLLITGAAALSRQDRWATQRTLLAVAALGAFVHHSRRMSELPVEPTSTQVASRVRGSGLEARTPPHYSLYFNGAVQTLPLRDSFGPTRILELPRHHNLAALSSHQTPVGDVSLRPRRVDRLVYQRRRLTDDDGRLVQTVGRHQRLLDLFNVRYLIVPRRDHAAYFDKAQWRDSLIVGATIGERVLIENRTRLPRSFFITTANHVRTEEEAYARVVDAAFDPRREVVIEADASASETPPAAEAPAFVAATVTHYDPEEVHVLVKAPRAGWLVLLDREAQGWSAEVNGRAVEIYRANYLFRAVRVAAGESQVTFRYRSLRFWWGAMLSLVGLGVAAAATVSIALGRARRVETASA